MYYLKMTSDKEGNVIAKIPTILLNEILKVCKNEIVETNKGNRAFKITENYNSVMKFPNDFELWITKGMYFISS